MSLESLDQYLSVCCLYETYVSMLLAALAQLLHLQFSIYHLHRLYNTSVSMLLCHLTDPEPTQNPLPNYKNIL